MQSENKQIKGEEYNLACRFGQWTVFCLAHATFICYNANLCKSFN